MHSKVLIWFILPGLALSVHAQVSDTNKQVRLISLSETLELALAHNLNLKVQRLVPQVARYNVEIAKAGGSSRAGLQNFYPGGDLITARNASYDPLFFAQAVKTYNSEYNALTYGRRDNLQNSVNDVNRRGFQNEVQNELNTQAGAARDLVRATATIQSHDTALASITEDLRTGRITPQQAQIDRADEIARYQNALVNQSDAQIILNNRQSRLQAAEAADAQALNNLARATEVQNFLNKTPIGGEIPVNGLIDPETGQVVYHREVTRSYDFTAGLRGALPIGTVYELRLDNEKFQSTVYDHEYATIASVTVGQPLLKNFLTDAARTTINVSKKDLEIAEWGLQFAIIDQLTQAELAYYDLIFARENVKVQEVTLETANRFFNDAMNQAKAGLIPALDVKQAQAQQATAQADLMAARRDLAVSENNLKNMITDNYAKALNVTFVPSETLVAVPEKYNLAESWAKALTARPEYNQARLELEKQNILIKFAKNQLLPSLDVIGSLAANGIDPHSYGGSFGAIDDRTPNYWFGAIMTMNIQRKEAKNRYKIAKVDKERALYMMQQLEQNILNQVENNMRIAQADFSRVEATRSARQFAEAALEAEQRKLDNGQSTAFAVVQMQKNLAFARFTEINALAAYNKALAQLYFSEGSTLQRHHIRLEK